LVGRDVEVIRDGMEDLIVRMGWDMGSGECREWMVGDREV
jgi:hypothetical protein